MGEEKAGEDEKTTTTSTSTSTTTTTTTTTMTTTDRGEWEGRRDTCTAAAKLSANGTGIAHWP